MALESRRLRARMASLLVLPLAVRWSRKRRAGGWLLAWVRPMRWMAALSWRLPARLRRCPWMLANHTGGGCGAERRLSRRGAHQSEARLGGHRVGDTGLWGPDTRSSGLTRRDTRPERVRFVPSRAQIRFADTQDALQTVPATFQDFRTDPAYGRWRSAGNWVDECQRSRYSRV